MTTADAEIRPYTILGQKYAYATVALVLGIACFINLAGMEKAVLAIIFAWMALKSKPAPGLNQRRTWAQAGLALGIALLVLVPTIIFLNFGRLHTLVDALSKLSNGR